jgi:hypothetical protein
MNGGLMDRPWHCLSEFGATYEAEAFREWCERQGYQTGEPKRPFLYVRVFAPRSAIVAIQQETYRRGGKVIKAAPVQR